MSSQSANFSLDTTLNCLKVGETALVNHVTPQFQGESGGVSDISRRLKELGFVQGEQVKILHKGYFGGEPLAVRVGQSTFALRNFEAALIGVTKISATAMGATKLGSI
ncbi:ferrous iron transport protein A [Undibacterium jejuense]|uniref:Ferrous iron transport protein A n=1 Tax=Undibacterium jejuense TaxID=1344949 RepID=A0A923KI83_9BURK|nr:FeoA family protein [Undibacterium jejuense]MBC3862227.1 ferrous iron transport protein A [Undibacterium jejuense]